nr:ABC transporter ATP-binding protein [uncultured Cetobacterium sp.]
MKEIRVEGIEYAYDKKKILKGIDLKFKPGELVGILGANGCGKSTLLKIMMGFFKAEKGDIYLDDKNLKNYSPLDFSRKVSFITQKSTQNINFTVLELLRLGRVPHIKNSFKGLDREDEIIVQNVIKELELEEFVSRDISSLSGGEFQKILLGRAFVQQGEAIFLDEPTSALDINHSLEFLEKLVEKIKKENLIGIIVIHDINLASLFCDRLYFIKDGKIKYSGTPRDVINNKTLEDVYGFIPKIIEDKGEKYILPTRSGI